MSVTYKPTVVFANLAPLLKIAKAAIRLFKGEDRQKTLPII